jgi:hypothetical protein
MIDFTITRRAWVDTYNDFRANYTSKDLDYTRRTVRVYNGANQRLLGYKRPRTIDLTAFTDVDTASKRLTEIMKRESYPEAQIHFSASLAYDEECHVGKIITINHDEYGIVSADFRITSRSVNEANSNLIEFKATQESATLWDDVYTTGGDPEWVAPDWKDVDPLIAQDYFELPYNSETLTAPTYLLLAARANQEDGFVVLWSQTGTDYATRHDSQMVYFSQYGTLDEAYPDFDETDAIDDDRGILYTPLREDPIFESISRSELFYNRRVAIINGTEMVSFQTVSYEGDSSIRLTGVVRGVMGTPTDSHSSGVSIWLANVAQDRNVMYEIHSYDFYVKMIPHLGQQYIDESDATAMRVTATHTADGFPPISRIEVERTGTSCDITFHFTILSNSVYGGGAGGNSSDTQLDSNFGSSVDIGVFLIDRGYEDHIEYKINSGTALQATENKVTYVHSGGTSFTLSARRRDYNDWISMTVGAADGTYIGPEL